MYSHSPATAGGRRWTLTKLAAATAVLATTLVGCGTEVELDGQHVNDKVPFLAQPGSTDRFRLSFREGF